MDVARLGLAVDSSQVEQGTIELHQLTGAAGQAQAAANRLAGAAQAEAAGHRAAAAAATAHNAALTAQNAVIRSSMQQRTMMIYQLNDVAVSLASGMNPAMVAMQQGSQILQGGLAPALRTINDLVIGTATRFAGLGAAVGAVTLLLYGFTRQINEANDSNVSMVDTALAMWQSLAAGATTLLGPAFTYLANEFNRAVDQITRDTTRELNLVIGVFVGTVEAIKAVWSVLPDAIGYITFEMARNVSNTIVKMQADVLSGLNEMFSAIDNMVVSMGGEAFLPRADIYGFGASNYKMEENPYASAGDAVGAAGSAFSGAMGQNYIGDWLADVGKRAEDIALAREQVDALGGSAAAANDNIRGLTSSIANIGPATVDPLTLAAQQLASLDAQLAQGAISWEQYGEAAFRANSGAASAVLGLAGQATSAMAQMFGDNKAFAIANAVVSTAEAVMKALATYGPTPWGFAAAGVAAATGAAQIATIMSAQRGSGSVSRPSGSGSTVNAGQQAQQAQRANVIQLNLSGSGIYSRDDISSLLEQLADGLNDDVAGGDNFRVAVTNR